MVNNYRFNNQLMKACLAAVITVGLAACSSSSDSPPVDAGIEDVRSEAMAAAEAANTAAQAAQAAVAGVTAGQAAEPRSFSDAQEAAKRAADAAAAAKTASDAAEAATTTAAAQAQLNIAEARKADAEKARDDAERYAGFVEAAHRINENRRMMDVADARDRAMQSYRNAKADAEKAAVEASKAEMADPGSPGATAARDAARAADTAAEAAKAALDAIMDGMTKAEADAEAAKAATEAGNANSAYMTAQRENQAVQNVALVADQLRMRDVAAAKTAANAAVVAAETARDEAVQAASDAEDARDDARDAYMLAMDARTDSAGAKEQYDEAQAAAMRARDAADAAEAAYMAAKTAAEGIDDDGTAEAAQMARSTAETQQGIAETQRDNAKTAYDSDAQDAMGAKQLAAAAETAAGTHILRLFRAANGAHVMDDAATMDVDETAAHVTSVGNAMATIANVASGAQGGGTTASATWPGDTVDNPATEEDNEFMEGTLTISVDPGGSGTAIPFNLMGVMADPDADPPVTAVIQTAREIDDLGTFQGYELWENDGDGDTNTDRARAIVFTDKQQGDDSVIAVTPVTAREANNVAVTVDTLTKLGTKSGNMYTGAEYTPSGEGPLTGTLTCPSGATCMVDATTAADGTVTINAVDGYVFTGSRAAVEAVTGAPATEDNDYLMFGLWLDENEDGATDTFGAFAAGGADYAVSVANAVTGTASYSGKAAGAHHKTGGDVNWFDGDASLTADFGTAEAAGTITGSISNIRVNGGPAMADSIELREAALADGNATFNGNARMGAAEIQDDDTVQYPFNGTWSGSFFGATEDLDTTDNDESVTAPLATAGTFGVTRTMDMDTADMDDDVIESFVGAFGAHKD